MFLPLVHFPSEFSSHRENCLKLCYVFLIRCHAAGDGNDQVNHENNRVNDNYKKDFSHFSLVQLENALVSRLNLKRERERQKRASRKVRKG